MLVEHDPLDSGGLELEVEFDDAMSNDEFAENFEVDVPDDEHEYDEYDEYDEYEEPEIDPFLERDISSQPGQAPMNPADPMAVFNGSKLMQDIMYYRTLGYSDEQILEGMSKSKAQGKNHRTTEEPPDFMSIGEEAAWYARKAVEEHMQELLNPVTQKLSEYEQHMQRNQMEGIKQSNGTAFKSTLNKYGYSPSDLSQQDFDRLDAAMEKMYPGVDFNVTKLTPHMAEGIVRLAFASGGGGSRQRTQQRQPAPRIMGGGASSRASGTTRSFKIDGVPKNERIARMKQFLG